MGQALRQTKGQVQRGLPGRGAVRWEEQALYVSRDKLVPGTGPSVGEVRGPTETSKKGAVPSEDLRCGDESSYYQCTGEIEWLDRQFIH